MKNFNIDDLLIGNFKIIISKSSDALEIFFVGDFDLENPYIVLDPFFDRLHSEIQNNNIRNININAKDLNFINSSSIKSIVRWIVGIQKLEANKKYTMTFKVNKNSLWQHLSFESLKYFAHDIVRIISI